MGEIALAMLQFCSTVLTGGVALWKCPALQKPQINKATVAVGVFDGHGPFGRGAAKYASTQIPALLSTHSAMANRASDKKRLRAMKEACEIVDSCMKDEDVCGFDATLSGTTACFAILWGRKVYLANTGMLC